jgi:nucleotide-binding universal stress UspA family protein
VAAVDGSPASGAAAHAAVRSAHQLRAPLELVRVLALPSEDPVDERGSGVALHVAEGQLDVLRRELAAVAPDVPVTAVVLRGRTGDELVEASRTAERIVLGEHAAGRGLGSVIDLVVRRAHSPVLLHRPGPRPTGAVVVGLDCLPGTEALLAVATDEAVLRGAVLHVVHGRAAGLTGPGLLDAERGLLERLVTCAQQGRPHLRAHLVVRRAGASSLLLDAAVGAQVLVLGRRTSTAGRRSSGTGATLLLRAPCPLLVVPAGCTAPTG